MIGAAFAAWIGWTVIPILVVVLIAAAFFLICYAFMAIDEFIQSLKKKMKDRN